MPNHSPHHLTTGGRWPFHRPSSSSLSPQTEYRETLVGAGRSACGKPYDRVVVDEHNAALDDPSYYQGAERPGDFPLVIAQQREREPEFFRIPAMGLHARRIHAKRLNPRFPILLDLIAHGGELLVSARGSVSGIEQEQHPRLPQDLAQPVTSTV